MLNRRLWLAGMGVVVLATLLAGCGPITFVVGLSPGDQRLTSTVVDADGKLGGDEVAIIDVSGMLLNANRPGLLQAGENPVSLLHEKLTKAAGDNSVKAIILRINSPGGGVTASDVMYRQVQRFKQQTDKPVVALLMDVAASGGYYLACASDKIIAYPTTVTGSIGVIFQTISIKPALARIGIQADAITSGPNKAAGSPLSNLTALQREILQKLVDDFYQNFVQVVRAARPGIDEQQFTTVTDGRVFSGKQAVEVGLVDQTGDLHDAFSLAKKLAKIPTADLVLYHRPLQYVGSPYAAAPTGMDSSAKSTQQINLLQLNLGDAAGVLGPGVGMYYLWCPQWE